ncbi:tetratricopeptide repeat protein [Hydrocoleum sp. CS-953]|uniref:tetratricopeptide repeat protein n=1 Tax=Hydrocoleum sp. CS-953 TaxID=1671698 RepID=UPI000B9A926F|nr:tetratricopeptide repeat protein [Hydrocoleum sp. CS-953]
MIQKFLLCCLLITILSEKTNNQALALPLPDKDTLSEALFTPSLAVSHPKSQVSEVLETVNQMDDSQAKAILLNQIALKYIDLGELEQAEEILAKSLAISKNLEEQTVQVNLLTNIAKQYAQIGQLDKAQEILELTVEIANSVEDKLTQGQLLLEIALTYQSLGLEDSSQTLISQSQTLISETQTITEEPPPVAEYPFQEERVEFSLGFGATISSFRDTTWNIGTNSNLYKQWSKSDLLINSSVSVSFDSSRAEDEKYRPSSFTAVLYRRHFNQDWHFAANLFAVTNQELLAAKNDDEDLTVIITPALGAGFNLWRGETAKESWDVQFFFSPRYEYDYIDFEERRNRVDPTLGIAFIGRDVKIGRATFNQIFVFGQSLRDSENLISTYNTTFSIPISKRWSFTNRLFLRFRNETIFEDNPKWNFYYTTGLDFKF